MIIVLMGVSGSGKTAVGKELARRLHWEFYEGDDFHPDSNIEKMRSGKPLSDEDRAPWLAGLRNLLVELQSAGRNAVVTCSALKEVYRRFLSKSLSRVRFVYLRGSYSEIRKRLVRRQGHFLPTELLRSQFDTLEEPQDVLGVHIDKSADDVAQGIIDTLEIGTSTHKPDT